MSKPTTSIRVILRDGFAHVGRLVRAHPGSFALAAGGAIEVCWRAPGAEMIRFRNERVRAFFDAHLTMRD